MRVALVHDWLTGMRGGERVLESVRPVPPGDHPHPGPRTGERLAGHRGPADPDLLPPALAGGAGPVPAVPAPVPAGGRPSGPGRGRPRRVDQPLRGAGRPAAPGGGASGLPLHADALRLGLRGRVPGAPAAGDPDPDPRALARAPPVGPGGGAASRPSGVHLAPCRRPGLPGLWASGPGHLSSGPHGHSSARPRTGCPATPRSSWCRRSPLTSGSTWRWTPAPGWGRPSSSWARAPRRPGCKPGPVPRCASWAGRTTRRSGLVAQLPGVPVPGEEEFGIAPLEAMAAGRPVVALRRGALTETSIDGLTGVFFDEATPAALADAFQRLAVPLGPGGHPAARPGVRRGDLPRGLPGVRRRGDGRGAGDGPGC